MLGCHPETVRRYVKEGQLRSVQFAGKSAMHRFDPAELERFLASGGGEPRE